MDTKFSIDPEFNVFDEWGSFRGKFIPSGGGGEGCLMFITHIIAGAIFFTAYLMIKLIIEGIKLLLKGNKKGFVYLAVPFIVCMAVNFPLIVGFAAEAAENARAHEISRYIYTEAVQSIECNGWSGVSYDAVNNWSKDVSLFSPFLLHTSPCNSGPAGAAWLPTDGLYLHAGERVSLYCQYPIDECGAFAAFEHTNIGPGLTLEIIK